MRILLTGSEGAIGQFILKSIHDKYHNKVDVIRIANKRKCNINYYDNIEKGDLTDLSFVQNVFRKHNITHIVHCAGVWRGYDYDFEGLYDNVTMMMNLLSQASESWSKFIFISSSAVCGKDIYKDTECNTTYGMSKLISEKLLLTASYKFNFPYTVFRPIHVVSPAEEYNPGSSHICTDIYHKLTKGNIDIDLDALSTDKKLIPTWVGYISDCVTNAMDSELFNNEIFNISGRYEYSVRDLVSEMIEQYNYNTPSKTKGWWSSYANDLYHTLGSNNSSNLQECISKFLEFKKRG